MAIERREMEDLITRLRSDNGQRNGEYDLARQRYAGVLWDEVTNPPEQGRYSLAPNYIKPITDKNIQLLVGQMPAIQVLAPGTDQSARQQAENLESLLYRAWAMNDATKVFYNTAFNSFVLRRGLVYYWWDHAHKEPRFTDITPDDFYPEWDGDKMYSVIYIRKRLTRAIRAEYPDHADEITEDEVGDLAQLYGADQPRTTNMGYTTCYYYFDCENRWAMIAGNYFTTGETGLPVKEVPFVEFPCFRVGGQKEPINAIDQIVELNQYLAQLLSQKADVIAKYSNPVILDYQSGQSPQAIRAAVSAPGAVLPIRRDGDIKFLNWEGTTPDFDSQIESIMDIMFDLSGKPRSAYGQAVTNQSGVITNLSLTPSLQSNEYHRDIWGVGLSTLNERILQMIEKFGGTRNYEYKGRIPTGPSLQSSKFRYSVVTPDMISGWYKNRIKWPAAIRVDDPVYIQNDLAQLQSDPPAISLYTSLENRGVEDVEAEIDRIGEQLEDPRMHPDRLAAGIDAVNALGGGSPEAAAMAGVGPETEMGGDPNGALAATGSPYADAMA